MQFKPLAWLTAGCLLCSNALMAQLPPNPDPMLTANEPLEYEIKEVRARGFVATDSAAIVNISGLTAGQTIRVPGDDLSRAIRKIWKQNLFVDVRIDIVKTVGDEAYLEIVVKEYPRLSGHAFAGIPKGQHDDINNIIKERYLVKGRVASQAMRQNAVASIKSFYEDKGYPDASVRVEEKPDPVYGDGYVRLIFNVNRGGRLRVGDIVFEGNEKVPSGKLRRLMKETKRFRWYNVFKQSKFIKEEFEKDKEKIVNYYGTQGMRDMAIVSDSALVVGNGRRKSLVLKVKIAEGRTYYFGDIVFRGNTTYPSAVLNQQLGIKKGDVYNAEQLQSRLSFDQNGRDISSLYMDNGHLFFRAEPIEKGIANDSVNVEIRISEGPVATIDKVIIKGNDRTHEHVIRRELRTLPGDKFSRSDIIRSQRELMALNYFNPETMSINTPVNPQRGTVDVEYGVEERPSDQLELSAGWGGVGRGVIGTLGVTFNNFSLRNLSKPELWSPLPQGDGQRLSIRAQTNGRYYQAYNFSFTEPWLGGRRPMALSVSAYHQRYTNGRPKEASNYTQLFISGASVGIGTRLRVPDDWFMLQVSLDYQNINVYQRSDFVIPTGDFHNLAFHATLSRNSIDNPTFPQQGSLLQMGLKFTLPYSYMFKRDYSTLTAAEKFKFLEYHKWDIKSEWYTPLAKNLVFKASAKMGFLGFYNSAVGLSPFERYELGGDGISNFVGLQGKTIVSMRGYKNPTTDVSSANQYGAAIYNKYTAELRYLVSPNPSATFYVTAFAQAGNAWSRLKDYNPFHMRRSVGLGLRAFLPMFGTLGFDYGIGFDKNITAKNIFDYGSFNIVLGFEPE